MGLFVAMLCAWHQDARGRRICRTCAPKVLEALRLSDIQRDIYAQSVSAASVDVIRLGGELRHARHLLLEAAECMKRGRLARPLSGRIVAFLNA